MGFLYFIVCSSHKKLLLKPLFRQKKIFIIMRVLAVIALVVLICSALVSAGTPTFSVCSGAGALLEVSPSPPPNPLGNPLPPSPSPSLVPSRKNSALVPSTPTPPSTASKLPTSKTPSAPTKVPPSPALKPPVPRAGPSPSKSLPFLGAVLSPPSPPSRLAPVLNSSAWNSLLVCK